jgi:hypothetical protein
MANSTHVITDLETLAASAFTAASEQATAADDIDLQGMANSVKLAALEARKALQAIAARLDPADPALTLANDILGTLS